jgi:hypothetical protein
MPMVDMLLTNAERQYRGYLEQGQFQKAIALRETLTREVRGTEQDKPLLVLFENIDQEIGNKIEAISDPIYSPQTMPAAKREDLIYIGVNALREDIFMDRAGRGRTREGLVTGYIYRLPEKEVEKLVYRDPVIPPRVEKLLSSIDAYLEMGMELDLESKGHIPYSQNLDSPYCPCCGRKRKKD